MRVLNWLYDNLHKLVEALIVLTVALMILDVVVGVFARYVLNNAIPWVEEASRYMMIWMAYLAMGMVIREEGNISVTFMVNWFPPVIRRVIKVLGLLIIGFFLAVVWALKKRRQQHYLTIGLSIMDIRPVRVDETVHLVRTADAPYSGKVISARVACLIGGLLIVFAAGLLAYEVILYA